MKKKSTIASLCTATILSTILVGCAGSKVSTETEKPKVVAEQVVNVYSDRNYDTDKKLYEVFTKETGIKVNLIEGNSDELIERLAREGKDSKADVLITADAGRLHKAKEQNLLQPVTSDGLFKNVPENLRDKDNQWFALTMRARVIVYSKANVKPEELSTYENLTDSKWKGKILVRPSSSVYNQSLLASFIAVDGEDKAKIWAKGIVANLGREPKGNDRDQAKAIVAGEGDIAIMNTYYVGKMLNSADAEEVKVAQKVGVFFPNQDTTGTHINISGAGVTSATKNKDNAVKLIEFLSGIKAQKEFAEANYEYPVNPQVQPSELLKSWGEFKKQDINISILGELNKKSVQLLNEVGWK
jgi:iron(III) transport system substrate-binding protein